MEAILETIKNQEPLKDILGEKEGIDLNNAGKPSEEIPLHLAVKHFNRNAVNDLLEKGADIDVKNDEGKAALAKLIDGPHHDSDEYFSTFKLLLDKGIDVPKDTLIRYLSEYGTYPATYLLIRNDPEFKLDLPDVTLIKMLFGAKVRDSMMVVKLEADDDIVVLAKWFVNHPQFEFPSVTWDFGSLPVYKAIQTFVELQQWEDAIRLACCQEGIVGKLEEKFGPDEHLVSKSFENMTDFSFVDQRGIKLLDAVFQMYCNEAHKFQVSVGKKLLELGADKDILMTSFFDALHGEGYWGRNYDQYGNKRKNIKQLIKTGIDLESCHKYGETDYVMKDHVYLTAAEYCFPDILRETIEKGADLFSNFDSSTEQSSIDLCMKKLCKSDRYEEADECLEIILKEIAKRGDLGAKMVKAFLPEHAGEEFRIEKRLVDYLVEEGNEEILSKIGFWPKTPTILEVNPSGGSVHMSWESGEELMYPVTGYRIQVMKMTEGKMQKMKIKKLLMENPLIQKMGDEFDYEFEIGTREAYRDRWDVLKAAGMGSLLEAMPVTEKKIQEEMGKSADSGGWKTVMEVAGGNQTSRKISPLQHGVMIKFRVFAVNENGVSNPPAETEFQEIKVRPTKPARPEVSAGNQVMTWCAQDVPEVTMYRVEGRTRDGEWRMLEKISAEYSKEVQLSDFSDLGLSAVRVVALNDDEESDPSDPWDLESK